MHTASKPARAFLRPRSSWIVVAMAMVALAAATGCRTSQQRGSGNIPSKADSAWGELSEALPAEGDASESEGAVSGENARQLDPIELTGSLGEPTILDRDPCRLITVEEWGSWLRQKNPSSQELEEGEACGFKGGDDTVRMAIGVVPFIPASPERFLPPEIKGKPQTLGSVAGVQRAVWVEQYPIEQSSTLVVEMNNFDLVIEMTSRGSRSQEDLRRGAIAFAEKAFGRIS